MEVLTHPFPEQGFVADHTQPGQAAHLPQPSGPSVGFMGLDLGSTLVSQTNPYIIGPFGISL